MGRYINIVGKSWLYYGLMNIPLQKDFKYEGTYLSFLSYVKIIAIHPCSCYLLIDNLLKSSLFKTTE